MPGSPCRSQEAACGSVCHPGPLIDLTCSHLSPHRLTWPGTCLMCEAGALERVETLQMCRLWPLSAGGGAESLRGGA